jgi:hypothetical protein
MKTKGVIISLIGVNVILLLCMAAQPGPDRSQEVVPKIRTQAIELVDEQGRDRASLPSKQTAQQSYDCAIQAGQFA